MHNPKINWETKEVKMIRCLLLCKRNIEVKENIEQRKKIGKRIRVVDQANKEEQKWTIEEKFDNEVKLNREKVRKMVSQRSYQWLKVFKKVELKRILVKKPQDHVINLRKDFVPRKGRTYLILRVSYDGK